MCGPSTAGGAYLPTMSEEVPIVKGLGALYLGGPPLVRVSAHVEVRRRTLPEEEHCHSLASGCNW